MFSVKFDVECTASHRPASLRKTSSPKAFTKQDTARAQIHQDTGVNWHPISFTLVVDNYGMKYINKNNVDHLTSVLKQDYKIDTNWEGTQYLGLALNWDYGKRKVHLSMPSYIENALIRFGHECPNKPQLQPHPHTLPTYGATVQYAKADKVSPSATNAEGKFI